MQPVQAVRGVHTVDQTDASFADAIEKKLGQRKYNDWFHNKVTYTITTDTVVIGVGSDFLLSWMQREFLKPIAQIAQSLIGVGTEVRFKVDTRVAIDSESSASQPKESPSTQQEKKNSLSSSGKDKSSSDKKQPPKNKGRRFANLATFVVGSGSELAVTAIHQVCESPGAQYNPLVLHGEVGLGKTHLLEGIYKRIRSTYPSLNVLFMTAEDFTNYFTSALRNHTLPSFRQRFRNIDVLLIDDIDFLNGKLKIQEEFLHTFKKLESHSRQIVLTANCHPRLMPKMSEELTTRFLSGMVCRVEPPDMETRLTIATQKATALGVTVAPEALGYVASRFRNNVRELEGAMNVLAAYATLTKKRVTLSATKRVLADLQRDCTRIVKLNDVEEAVCEFFGVETSELKSSRRDRSISQPRMMAMFLARKLTGAAYSEIGNFFGGRNHSTVKSAEKKVLTWIDQSSELQIASYSWTAEDILDQLEQKLRAS